MSDIERDTGAERGTPNDEVTVSPAGLRGVGSSVEGTDARPSDPLADVNATPPDGDAQGGENEQEDARRAHGQAQGVEGPLQGGLDDTRASGDAGSLNNNGEL